MDKRPRIPNRQTVKPSKLVLSIALASGFLLSCLLVKQLIHRPNSNITNQTITLPELSESDDEETNESDSESAMESGPDYQAITEEEPPPPVVEPVAKIVKPKVAVTKDNEWQYVHPRPGDSMAAIFNRLGLTAKNLHEVLNKNPHVKALTNIKPSQKLEFLINKHQLQKLVIPVNYVQTLTVYRAGSVYKSQMAEKKTTSQNRLVTGTIKGSLSNTARQLNLPNKLVAQMTEILNKQIDFSRAIRPGDQFSIVYEAFYIEDRMVGTGDIQALRYTSRGSTFEAIRHTSRNGSHDYYTPKGNSFKKAFSRYPIKFSHISSTFTTSRLHPVLHYKRAHKGIDLAAPIGTPILATGDGVIEVIDRHNGYGNMIKIKHDKTYSSIYGHMLRFQRGLSRGSRVKRGQVIGYVGQTGLATGPHCHYELHVHNQPRNPTTIQLPNASPIPNREIAAFKYKANTMLAKLKLYENANIASRGAKKSRIG